MRAIALHPTIWLSALGAVFRLARQGWWRRPPFLPLPGEEYWRFRMVTVYGGPDDGRTTSGVGPTRRGRHGLPPMVSEVEAAPRIASLRMERVLLLNATYEPLALVSDRRAVVLLLAGRAEAVAIREDCSVFHSARLSVDVPSIVRLCHMVRIPRWARTPPVTRRSVLRRDGGLCVYCSQPADTIDHVIPRSRGGTHDWSNVVAACKRDNLVKADQLLSELGWTLRGEAGAARWAPVEAAPSLRCRPAVGAVSRGGFLTAQVARVPFVRGRALSGGTEAARARP